MAVFTWLRELFGSFFLALSYGLVSAREGKRIALASVGKREIEERG